MIHSFDLADFELPVMIYGAMAIFFGLMFLFFGARLFRTVMASTGFIAGALLCYSLISRIRETHSWGQYGDLYGFLLAIASGTVGSIISLSVWMIALIVVGSLAGTLTVIYILGYIPDLVATSNSWVPPALLAIGAVIGALLAALYERAIIILATSITGAISLSSGVDVFFASGFNHVAQEIIRHHRRTIPVVLASNELFALLVSAAVMAVIGFLVQVFITAPDSSELHYGGPKKFAPDGSCLRSHV